MEREFDVKINEVEKQLHYAVLDNLILSYTGVGFKGSKTGIEYEGFRIPDAGEIEQVSSLYKGFRIPDAGEIEQVSGLYEGFRIPDAGEIEQVSGLDCCRNIL